MMTSVQESDRVADYRRRNHHRGGGATVEGGSFFPCDPRVVEMWPAHLGRRVR